MNLFDVINEELFKPLVWSNKRRYMDILSILWDSCRRKPMYSMNKTEMIDLVEAYIIGAGEEIVIDEESDDETPEKDDYRSLAAFFLRKLRAAGWLIERTGEYEEENKLALDHHIIPILRSFADVINPKIVTYKGKLFEIYSMLSHIDDVDNPYETCLKETCESFNDLNLSLHQLDASIEEHISELTAGKSPEDILAFFEEYEQHIVIGAYQRFKTNDNLFYYRNSLYERIDYCEDSLFGALVKDYAETEHTTEDVGKYEIEKLIRSMRDSVEEMEELITAIDRHHILYRTRAVQRAQFLLLSDGSTKGKIAGLLRHYADTLQNGDSDTPETDEAWFQVFSQSYVDHCSLYTPYKRKRSTPIDEITDIEPLDDNFINEQNRALMEYARNALTLENVNIYAKELLSGKRSVAASYVLEQDPSAVVKIVGLYTYSQSPERSYNLSLQEEYVTVSSIRFKNFLIERV